MWRFEIAYRVVELTPSRWSEGISGIFGVQDLTLAQIGNPGAVSERQLMLVLAAGHGLIVLPRRQLRLSQTGLLEMLRRF